LNWCIRQYHQQRRHPTITTANQGIVSPKFPSRTTASAFSYASDCSERFTSSCHIKGQRLRLASLKDHIERIDALLYQNLGARKSVPDFVNVALADLAVRNTPRQKRSDAVAEVLRASDRQHPEQKPFRKNHRALTFALCLQPIKMGAILICSLRDLSNPNLSASRKIFV
jgi:hypothetical protein